MATQCHQSIENVRLPIKDHLISHSGYVLQRSPVQYTFEGEKNKTKKLNQCWGV